YPIMQPSCFLVLSSRVVGDIRVDFAGEVPVLTVRPLLDRPQRRVRGGAICAGARVGALVRGVARPTAFMRLLVMRGSAGDRLIVRPRRSRGTGSKSGRPRPPREYGAPLCARSAPRPRKLIARSPRTEVHARRTLPPNLEGCAGNDCAPPVLALFDQIEYIGY